MVVLVVAVVVVVIVVVAAGSLCVLSARGLARSLARSQLPARFRPLVLRAIRPRSALVGCHPAAMAGTQDSAPGPTLSAGREEKRGGIHGGRERGRRDLVGASGAGSDRCTCATRGWRGARGKGYGEESADGVGNCARASQPLANERTSVRASERANERPRGCAPLEQLPFSSFRVVSPNVVLQVPAVSAAFAECTAKGKAFADLRKLRKT